MKFPKKDQISNLVFNVHKFTTRSKPKDPKNTIIFSCFNEFGCETLTVLYVIPKLLERFSGKYTIAAGWYGREYFYRHLVDEYWELKEEFQYLRDDARAFGNESYAVKRFEQRAGQHGQMITLKQMGQMVVASYCRNCKQVVAYTSGNICPKCKKNIDKCLFADVKNAKNGALRLPAPAPEKVIEAEKYIRPMSVGIFARGRKTYGRNLQPEFYVKLISLLREKRYHPIWMGEKQSTLPCPVDDIMDLSRMDISRDLEVTLAIVSKCVFTVQYWTASTRLAGMMGIPYVLFESPDQIFGAGQEGYRRNLCDFGPRKLCLSHFTNVYNDNDSGIELTNRCIEEIEQGNYDDVFGMLDIKGFAENLKRNNQKRIGDA